MGLFFPKGLDPIASLQDDTWALALGCGGRSLGGLKDIVPDESGTHGLMNSAFRRLQPSPSVPSVIICSIRIKIYPTQRVSLCLLLCWNHRQQDQLIPYINLKARNRYMEICISI